MPSLFLVMAGGAIGAGARHLFGRLMLALSGPALPWGTLGVNLIGGLLMGLLAGSLAKHGPAGEGARLFLGVGVIGGFTTFSAFGLDTVTLALRGEMGIAAGYVVLSVAGTIVLLLVGLRLARVLA